MNRYDLEDIARRTAASYNLPPEIFLRLINTESGFNPNAVSQKGATGLTQLINLGRFSSNDNFAKKRTPILWNIGNQMTGDTIHLISNPETKKLDSLKVFDNAFIISNDTLGDGYHQMSGKQLFGFFEDNKLSTIDIIKNAESIYYMRNDENELVGTDKSKSGIIKIWITDNAIEEVRKIKDVDGNVFPEGEFPEKESLLRDFVWLLS